jgi:hypothetical protein
MKRSFVLIFDAFGEHNLAEIERAFKKVVFKNNGYERAEFRIKNIRSHIAKGDKPCLIITMAPGLVIDTGWNPVWDETYGPKWCDPQIKEQDIIDLTRGAARNDAAVKALEEMFNAPNVPQIPLPIKKKALVAKPLAREDPFDYDYAMPAPAAVGWDAAAPAAPVPEPPWARKADILARSKRGLHPYHSKPLPLP